jgi:hypothetical protein
MSGKMALVHSIVAVLGATDVGGSCMTGASMEVVIVD